VTRRYANPREVAVVRWLFLQSFNDCQIERITGIPRRTILDWRHRDVTWPWLRPIKQRTPSGGCPRCEGRGLDQRAYSYLLGLYLGDGYIARQPKGGYRLRIVCAERYPRLIEECKSAMAVVRGVERLPSPVRRVGCVEIQTSWNHWPCLFPQHGPGRKHERSIQLAPWQWGLVFGSPRELLRGLLHSDGCRVLNRVNGTTYPRYLFTNFSRDIRAIFTTTCDLLAIRWRRPKWNTISVARRQDVAFLDSFVGPKR
jgi:hypothetical protein